MRLARLKSSPSMEKGSPTVEDGIPVQMEREALARFERAPASKLSAKSWYPRAIPEVNANCQVRARAVYSFSVAVIRARFSLVLT